MDYPEVGKLARKWVWPDDREDRLALACALAGIGSDVAQLHEALERVDDGSRRAFRLRAALETLSFAARLCCEALGPLAPAEEEWPAKEGSDGEASQ